MGTLTLKPEQDGLGYFYGTYGTDDGDSIRVDVLPPKSYPRPMFVAASDAQHDTLWIVYADGEEVARVASRDDVTTLDIGKLLPAT